MRCKHEFCFDCLADHKAILLKDNTAHAATCRFHPSNLPELWPEFQLDEAEEWGDNDDE